MTDGCNLDDMTAVRAILEPEYAAEIAALLDSALEGAAEQHDTEYGTTEEEYRDSIEECASNLIDGHRWARGGNALLVLWLCGSTTAEWESDEDYSMRAERAMIADCMELFDQGRNEEARAQEA